MWRVVIAVVVVGAGTGLAAPRLKDEPRKESPIIGEWVAERAEQGATSVEFYPGAFRFTFAADGRLVQTFGGVKSFGGYEVDARASPASIDLSLPPKGPADHMEPGLGIFRVKGDTLEICVRNGPGERPAAFTAGVGSGNTLMTFKRVKK